MTTADYSAAVAAAFWHSPQAGAADGPGWVTGEAREPLTGTRVRWCLRVDAGRVADVRYQVRGCPHTLAVAAHAAAALRGQPLAGATVDVRSLAVAVGAPPAKLGRLFAIEDAVTAAVAAGLKLDPGTA